MISGLSHLKNRSSYSNEDIAVIPFLQPTNPDPMFLATWKLLALTVNPVKYQVSNDIILYPTINYIHAAPAKNLQRVFLVSLLH